MGNFRTVDMMLVDDLFDMGGGYVLDFSDRTFGDFFRNEIKVDIDDPKYSINGGSKAKRLRYFLQTTEKAIAIRALKALWEYRTASRRRRGQAETVVNAAAEFAALIERLGGKNSAPTGYAAPDDAHKLNPTRLTKLSQEFIAITSQEPHARGYAFEKFLKSMFDAYGLDARAAFRIRGEQIDGSLQLSGETYLVEARWRNAPSDAAALYAFHGKLAEKASWSRGLFIAMNGFSEDGLHAFGRGKRLICMDGLDLYEMLERSLRLDDVLARKVRRAAETGSPFARVRELFPT